MAAGQVDGFLELIRGGQVIAGEAQDKVFGKKKASAILDFNMTSEASARSYNPNATPEDGEDEDSEDAALMSMRYMFGDEKFQDKCPITFTINKYLDSVSTQLYLSYCQHTDEEDENDQPFDTARITLRKAAGPNPLVFLVLEFGKAHVTSYQVKGEGDDLPKETVSFTCRSCKIQYRPQTAKGFGSVKIAGWDFDQEAAIGG